MALKLNLITSLFAFKANLLLGVASASCFIEAEEQQIEQAKRVSVLELESMNKLQRNNLENLSEEQQVAIAVEQSRLIYEDRQKTDREEARLVKDAERKSRLESIKQRREVKLSPSIAVNNSPALNNEMKLTLEQKARELNITVEEYQAIVALEQKSYPKLGESVDPRTLTNFIIDPYNKGVSINDENNNNKFSSHNGNNLKFERSSAMKNNCLLYSIFRNNQDLLFKVLKDRTLVRNLIAIPEHSDHSDHYLENRRDLSIVRQRIFEDISTHLDVQYEQAFNGELRTLRNAIEDIQGYENSAAYREMSIETYLQRKANDESVLEVGYADVISVLYNIPIYVMIPREDYPNRLNFYNGTYFNLNKIKESTIFVYHPGEGNIVFNKQNKAVKVNMGNHYSKLSLIQ